MSFTQVIILVIVGIIWNLSETVSSCKFGEDCDYPCHCQNDVVCDANNGSCPNGCDDGDIEQPGDYWHTGAWSGYGCQIGNVAYGKNATQYLVWLDYIPSRAVDGNHDPIPANGHCAHPGSFTDVVAWWSVDLGANHVVLSINISNRLPLSNVRYEERTAFLNIYVSETPDVDTPQTLCYAVLAEGSMLNTHANCLRPMFGRYVKLKRHTGPHVHESNWMNICEVQVYGYIYHDCPDDYFGVACSTTCNCRGPCDDIYGKCLSGQCLGGWDGRDCQTPCDFGVPCPSGCHMNYGGLNCDLVLPRMDTVVLSSASQTSLTVRFVVWKSDNDTEGTPTGYKIQWRLTNNMAWMPSLEIQHTPDSPEHVAVLKDLEPDTLYHVNIIPFIEEDAIIYLGFAHESGPFRTLGYGDNKAPLIAGVVVALIVIVILVVVVVLLARKYRKQRLTNNKESTDTPHAENGFENPSVEDGGFPQHTYAEILDVVKPLSLNAKTQLKGNNESRQMAGGISTDEPGEKLQEYPHYQNQNAIERPNPPMDRASYIDMTKGFKEDFEKIRLDIRSDDNAEAVYEDLIPALNGEDNNSFLNDEDIHKHKEDPNDI